MWRRLLFYERRRWRRQNYDIMLKTISMFCITQRSTICLTAHCACVACCTRSRTKGSAFYIFKWPRWEGCKRGVKSAFYIQHKMRPCTFSWKNGRESKFVLVCSCFCCCCVYLIGKWNVLPHTLISNNSKYLTFTFHSRNDDPLKTMRSGSILRDV